MDMLSSIGDQLSTSFIAMWDQVVMWFPRVLGALIILLVGIWIAKMLKKLTMQLMTILKIEMFVRRVELDRRLQAAGISVSVSQMVAGLVYWVVFLVFLSAASTTLGVEVVTRFIDLMIGYIPSIVAGLVIMGIGVLVADALGGVLENVKIAVAYKTVVRWFVLVLAFITAIEQIGIDVSFLAQNIQLLVAGFSLALGLAFGLGGKDRARAFLDKHLA